MRKATYEGIVETMRREEARYLAHDVTQLLKCTARMNRLMDRIEARNR
jgi:predicted kinase